jgi:outer membrane murein-binding lipoprotein Lpp
MIYLAAEVAVFGIVLICIGVKIMGTLDDLSTAISNLDTEVTQVITKVADLNSQIAAAGSNDPKIVALTGQVNAEIQRLATVLNPPAIPNPPAVPGTTTSGS